MKALLKRRHGGDPDAGRRGLLRGLAGTVGGGLLALSGTRSAPAQQDDLAFPGDEPDVKVLYQLNHAEPEYQRHIVHSASVVLKHYNNHVAIVLECFGPGIHLLLKEPQRPVDPGLRERVRSLSAYGVKFHACGETLKALDLGKEALIDEAVYVASGVVDMVELQRNKGYTYVAW
ncbi:DsrE family protein [Thiohalorhabdus methylotrophus]|uniref:DsrE family protein n=1 Tax=Thiohalorhabdus methylotrophus TaxID=3242694 RepID=A0ABV4TR06_9GAMM